MKAQLQATPFIVILGIVTVGLIVIFGISMLSKVTKFANEVDTINFQKQMENQVQDLNNLAPRSNKQISLNTPNKIKAICFIDLTRPYNDIPFTDIQEQAQALQGTTYNVFFQTEKGTLAEPLKINNVQPQPNPVCQQTRGKLQITLENTGEYIQVT